MEFCTKCGTILRVKKRGPQKIFYCDCGYKVFSDNDFILKDKIDNKKEIGIIEDKNYGLDVHTHKCKKCSYNKAILIEIGTMYGDEAGIVRYKCGKCGYVEQVDDKIR